MVVLEIAPMFRRLPGARLAVRLLSLQVVLFVAPKDFLSAASRIRTR
jgi:hypothetical protein